MGELEFRSIALLPLISAICVFGAIIFYLLKAKKSPQLFSLLIFQFIMFLWPLGQAIQYCAAGDRVIAVTIYLIHTSVVFIGLAWYIFTLYFTGADGTISPKKIAMLVILPLLSYVIFLTNPLHHWYFKIVRYDPKIVIYVIYGSYYWFGASLTYGFVIAGVVRLAKYAAGQTGVAKKQAIALLLAPLLSLLVSFGGSVYFFFITRVSVLKHIDLTPTLFAVFIFCFSIAVFKYRFLDINPGALKRIFENLHDSILVVDNYHCIANLNDSFSRDWGRFNLNQKISALVNHLQVAVVENEASLKILTAMEYGTEKPVEMGELHFAEPLNKIYEVTIQRLDHQQKAYQGRIIIFHDITEYKRLHAELDLKNNELAITNEQLSGHLQTMEELAIANERNRVAREVHDTLGHSLTVLILLMKAVKIEAEVNYADSKEKLAEGIKIAQTELGELRRSISGLMSTNMCDPDMIEKINSLVRQTESLGVNVEFSIFERKIYDQMPVSIHKIRLSDTIYKICKEAITNSLRHGLASQINIIVKFSRGKIQLFILDNGRGSPHIIQGMGLSGMTDRVKELNGTIKFGSDGETGFNIHVELPLEM